MNETIEFREMRFGDLFRLGNITEYEGDDFAGDSVFIRKDRSIQGLINHLYQKFSLLSSLAFGRSPINYTVTVGLIDGVIVAVAWHRGSDKSVGIFVNSNYRKRGLATGVCRKLCDIVKGDMRVIYKDINPALKIFRKLGFVERTRSIELTRNKDDLYINPYKKKLNERNT